MRKYRFFRCPIPARSPLGLKYRVKVVSQLGKKCSIGVIDYLLIVILKETPFIWSEIHLVIQKLKKIDNC